jgi:hypothetical protein
MTLRALAVLVLLMASDTEAGPGGCGKSDSLTPYAFEQITVSTTAIGFTQATVFPSGDEPGIMAVLTVETADVRYRVDGLDPTAAVGDRVSASGTLTVCGVPSLRKLKFIREDAADATLSVTYYREGDE